MKILWMRERKKKMGKKNQNKVVEELVRLKDSEIDWDKEFDRTNKIMLKLGHDFRAMLGADNGLGGLKTIRSKASKRRDKGIRKVL